MANPSIFRRASPRGAACSILLCSCLWGAAVAAPPGAPSTEPPAAIRAAAEDFVRGQLPAGVQGIHVHADALDSRLRLARCATPLAANLVSGAELRARTAIRVSCGRGPATWTLYVPVTIESEIAVLVLRQSAAHGARLTPRDVSGETRTVAGLAAAYVTDAGTLAHQTLGRALPAGAVLTADMFVADFIVRQGQEVTLVASLHGIEVRASGKVLQDGRAGSRVRVQNLASARVVEGVVDPSGTINVTP
jgi:flagellar basal body P-ring formation protein FlgA